MIYMNKLYSVSKPEIFSM